MKIIKTIIMMFVFMMTISSVFSAGLFNSGCWFNDNPNLIFDVLVYNPDGTFKSSITLDKNTNLDLSINENDIVKVDLSKLTDNQNNIKSEEIYWLNSKRNDLKIGIQDNTNILTNLVNQSFSSNKFDFLNYLTNGLQSNQEYYQTNVKSISYNNGNPQSDFIETFKPNVGTYKMLVKTYDSCKGYPQDEVYKIFNINVKKSIPVPIIPPTNINGTLTSMNTLFGDYFQDYGSVMTNIFTDFSYNKDIKINSIYWGLVDFGSSSFFTLSDVTNSVGIDPSVNNGIVLFTNSSMTNITTIFNPPIVLNKTHTYRISTGNPSIPPYLITKVKINYSNTNNVLNSNVCQNGSLVNSIGNNTTKSITINNGCSGITLNDIFDNSKIILIDNSTDFGFYDINMNLQQMDLHIETQVNFNTNGIVNINSNGMYRVFYEFDETKTNGKIFNLVNGVQTFQTLFIDNLKTSTQWIPNNINQDLYLTGVQSVTYEINWLNAKTNIQTQNSNIEFFKTADIYDHNLKIVKLGISTPNTINNVFNNNINFKTKSGNIVLYGANYPSGIIGQVHHNKITNIKDFGFENINVNKFYLNTFKFNNNNVTFFDSYGMQIIDGSLWTNINGKNVGNIWLDNNGNDLFNCNGNLIDVINENVLYKVCDNKTLIYDSGTTKFYDYIIVTNISQGGTDPTIQIPQQNKNPVAILIFNGSNQVNVGDTICWDSTSSYDSDGTIVSKQIIEGNNTYTNKDSNCLTRNTSSIVDLRLTVTDNNGATNSVVKHLKWNKLPISCSANIPPTLVLSKTNIGNNYYWLNMTTIDLNNDSLLTSWSVNGNIVNGKNVLQHIDYTQDVFGYVYDGCNITSNYININVGINQSNSLNPLTSNLICNNDNIYPNSNLNCNLKYNLNGRILNNITWNYDNNIINNNSENFTKIITDTNYHIISVTLNTNNGDSITKYFNFNLIKQPQTNNGGGNTNNGGGSGGSTTKNNCDIIVNPNPIKIDNNNLIQVSFNNNEIGSWTPDYSFNSIIDVNSSKNRLSITNVFGTFNSKQTKIIGIKYTQDILNQNSIYTKDNLVLTSTNCRDIIIPIEVNISQQQISSFVSPTILSSIKNGNLFTNSVLTKKQIPVGNNLIDKFKIWHLVSMIFMFFTFIFWGVKYSRNKIGNSVLVISSIILTTTFVSTLLIYVIRTFIGKL